MRKIEGKLRLSASDLMKFKGCRHAATLDLRQMELGDLVAVADGDDAELLQRQGDQHELAYLEALKADGKTVVEIPKEGLSLERSVELTLAAMADGPDVIFQGALLGGPWGGYTDFLERVDAPSTHWPWSYEVADTKLKRKPDPKHVLQLCLYSDLLADIQGVAPEAAHLQLGGGSRFSVRLADVSAYGRHARRVFERFLVDRPATRAEPVSGCKLCRWRGHCQDEWETADDISLVAGLTKIQRGKFEAAGITTVAGLAAFDGRVPKLSSDTQNRLQSQARLQSVRCAGGPPSFELRAPEAGKGFGLLPAPSDHDLFYDIEGDPYFEGGLEYLHGVWYRDGGGWTFRAFWAHDREAEGMAVAELLAFFVDHLRRHPEARIYHYANYEIAALRRLTAEHRVGEAAMDQLQRERRFVDLFSVVQGALIASEKGYSIKDLEAFYMSKRQADVATAGASVVFYELWRETGDSELLDKIHDYNQTDCISTQLLRDWLVSDVRPMNLPWPILGEVPNDSALGNVEAEDAEVEDLRGRLEPVRARLGDAVADLLLDLAFFHKREDKPSWWAIFDRLAQESEELLDDLECIQGLVAVGDPVKVTAKSFERTYAFPAQETKLRAGRKPCVKPAAMPEDVDLRSIDHDTNTLVLRRSTAKGPLPDRLDLLPPKPIGNTALRSAIATVTDEIIRDTGRFPAIEDLLTRATPRFVDGPRTIIVDPSADLPLCASAAIADMDGTAIGMQGPPGTGKTYVSALSIVDLVRSGKRVAVSSNSHAAITNVLEAIADRAAAGRMHCLVVQKASADDEEEAHPGIVLVADNDAEEIAAADVMGATAWHFARYDKPVFDYLFVDEAGQVSLANIVAMSRAARNIVLVGDPMQLPQPIQGTHPGQSGLSCLEHLIGDHRVIPADRGIFLPVSRRMHPRICDFISSAVYERRLESDETAASQRLTGIDGTDLVGAGVRSVIHLGRSQVSPEEIAAIRERIDLVSGAVFRGRDGIERVVGHSDIMVVAPYNAQVNALRAALPAAVRVGTVDRFQGQEAPICLVSMTTSSAEELPRDIEFLFSLNRINVAVSRAQVSAMVFASPLLLETPCRTVEQITLVNALCALREHGGDSF